MYTLRDMHNRRDQFRSDQAWRERTQNDPTSPGNWHRLATEEKIKKRALDEVNQRKLEEQKLKNTGLVDVARTTGEAGIERQGLQNLGQADVAQTQEAGATERTGMANNLVREERPFKQFKDLSTLGQSEFGQNTDYIENYRNFKNDPDFNTTGQAATDQNADSKYDKIKKYDNAGNLIGVNYYNKSDGSFAYFDSGEEPEKKEEVPGKPAPLANIDSMNTKMANLQKSIGPPTGAGSLGWLPNFAATNLVPAAQTFNKMALGGIGNIANTMDRQSKQPALEQQILELRKQPRYKNMSDLELYRLITTNQGT